MGVQNAGSVPLRRLLAGTLLVLAGLSYASWTLDGVLHSGLDPMHSMLSELSSARMPDRMVYVVGDVVTGSCALVAALTLLAPRRIVRNRIAVTAVAAVGVFGAATIADALLPLECIPGRDADCPAQPRGVIPQLHSLHALTSSVAVSAMFVAMVAASLAAVRHADWPWMRRGGMLLFAVVVLATAWFLGADRLGGDYRLGLAQRIQVTGMSLWTAYWGLAIIAWRPDPTPDASDPGAGSDAAGPEPVSGGTPS
ncbi:DUF998 domain-containing protein [Gordonia shandongensis]|uniref:DUF998 domain-containing protein n=1 Tax=Gordonia shandongensis TaxID=376351 RepID=UPI000405D709|nr:DUF998 domain-containing protein [Gordonia shandongensis]